MLNDFTAYHYVYKDMSNNWNLAKNPVFIAEHTYCRAVKKEEHPDIGKLLQLLNDDKLLL